MKEKVNEISFEDVQLPLIKGHTRIELTSVKDGSKKIIEHDNTFQSSVIAKYLRSLGTFDNSPWANTSWGGMQMFNMLCGGILLFEDAIDNTQNDVEYMPAGNKMIANGAFNVSNASTPVELGTYNAVESSTSGNNSLTFVYDWGTSQGNGTISCVCLTSEIGGYIGYGNPSGVQASTLKSMKQNQASRLLQEAGSVIYKNVKHTFSINATAKRLTVTKTRFAVSQASVFQGKQISVTDLTFTQDISTTSSGYLFKYIGGGKVAIMPSIINVANGSTLYFLIFDLENNTFSQGLVVNNTGNALETGFTTSLCLFGMVGDYVALSTRSAGTNTVKLPIYVFDATDGSLVYTVSGTDDLGGLNPAASPLTDELMLLANGGVFDSVNETAYPCNGYMSENGFGGFYQYNDDVDALVGAAAGGATGAFKNPLFLATINNLETPVTKDSTQTMKVIYTLTEA